MTEERNEVHRLMLKISRMQFDLNIELFDIGIKQKRWETYIAHTTVVVTEKGLDGKPREKNIGLLGDDNTPEKALQKLYDKIRDKYPAPSPYPPIEEMKKKIFEHPLNGEFKIDKIWIQPLSLSDGPHSTRVIANVRSNLGSARYFGQEVGTFGAVGQDEREALYWLLQRIDEEFAKDEYLIGVWDSEIEMYIYLRDYICDVKWTRYRRYAKTFTRKEKLNFLEHLDKVNKALPFDAPTTTEAHFMRQDCPCSHCRRSEREL